MTPEPRDDAPPPPGEAPASAEPPVFDADGALTREYLLARGRCCENGCRNCPWGFAAVRQSPSLLPPS